MYTLNLPVEADLKMVPCHRMDIGATMITNGKELLNVEVFNIICIVEKTHILFYLDLESPDSIDGTIQDGNLTPKAYPSINISFYLQ